MPIMDDVLTAMHEAERDDLRPLRWRLSHPAYYEIISQSDQLAMTPDGIGNPSLLGLPYSIDGTLTEPFVLETKYERTKGRQRPTFLSNRL